MKYVLVQCYFLQRTLLLQINCASIAEEDDGAALLYENMHVINCCESVYKTCVLRAVSSSNSTRSLIFSSCSFFAAASAIWNSLPDFIHMIHLSLFGGTLKEPFLSAFNTL